MKKFRYFWRFAVRSIGWAVLFLSCSICAVVYAQEYRLGPEDVLEVTVYREDELNRKVRISSSGYISLPLLGEISAEGLTVSELEGRLKEKFRKYLKSPQVTVFIEEYSTITVSGQVNKPDSYPLKGHLTVMKAISLAKGFTVMAAQNEVKIMRMENNEKKIITVRVADISRKGDSSQDIELQRGDIVFVPESTITITGQVKKPDSYPLKEGITVLEAISMAGGFTKFASRNKVKVMRVEEGEKKAFTVKVADISKSKDQTEDVLLKRGDIVFVPESLF